MKLFYGLTIAALLIASAPAYADVPPVVAAQSCDKAHLQAVLDEAGTNMDNKEYTAALSKVDVVIASLASCTAVEKDPTKKLVYRFNAAIQQINGAVVSKLLGNDSEAKRRYAAGMDELTSLLANPNLPAEGHDAVINAMSFAFQIGQQYNLSSDKS